MIIKDSFTNEKVDLSTADFFTGIFYKEKKFCPLLYTNNSEVSNDFCLNMGTSILMLLQAYIEKFVPVNKRLLFIQQVNKLLIDMDLMKNND